LISKSLEAIIYERRQIVELQELRAKVKIAFDKLYEEDQFLFNNGLSERCIVHRFAVHLESDDKFRGYYVDCEYNRSNWNEIPDSKTATGHKGNYIDIVITKRDGNYINDLVCFEVKKANTKRGTANDREKLRILTGGRQFGYAYGMFVVLYKNKAKTKIELYCNGVKTEDILIGQL
jgi:hypothetical protein